MGEIIALIVFIIALLAMVGRHLEAGGVIVIIALVAFLFYKLMRCGTRNPKKQQLAYYAENQETVETAMQFISFIDGLNMGILHFAFIQSQSMINAVVKNEDLGVATKTFLEISKIDPANEKLYRDWYCKQWECFLNSTSKKQFYQLPIYMDLWNNDDKWVQIHMPLHVPGDIHIFQEVINSECQERLGKDINLFIE